MTTYKAYKFILFPHVDGRYSAHWLVRDTDMCYYHHRVGGPPYVRYNSEGSVLALAWYLNGEEYPTEAEYQEALEKWLG